MSSSPNTDNLLLGAGAIYFNRHNASGQLTGDRHLGNCSSFVVKTEILRKENPEITNVVTDLPQYINTGFKMQGQMTLDEFSRENVALVLAGAIDITHTQVALTVTEQPYTIKKGQLISLINATKRVFGTVVTEVKIGTTVYVSGTDYIVTKNAGVIMIPDTSTIPDNSTILVTYDIPGKLIPQISIANEATASGKITFIGDPTSGPAYLCEIESAVLSVDEGISLIGNDFAQLTISFVVTKHSKNVLSGTAGFYNLIELPA